MEKPSQNLFSSLFLTFFLGCGIALGCFFIGHFIEKSVILKKKHLPSVQTRGLVEKQVKSDKADMKISFSINGNDLSILLEKSKETRDKVRKFLIHNGIKQAELGDEPTRINDQHVFFTPTVSNPKFLLYNS
ncbi:hypothetical protein AGMMS49949_04400 [Alphaproteobacteria bacterium]|nr:hypothetical protein AGMMS49949_04400 [Alphaproteobacteria bacterium]GHS97629.1 hypothetical protein AGMMS50296_4760 [Alphaproteobacteria bacterium]